MHVSCGTRMATDARCTHLLLEMHASQSFRRERIQQLYATNMWEIILRNIDARMDAGRFENKSTCGVFFLGTDEMQYSMTGCTTASFTTDLGMGLLQFSMDAFPSVLQALSNGDRRVSSRLVPLRQAGQ